MPAPDGSLKPIATAADLIDAMVADYAAATAGLAGLKTLAELAGAPLTRRDSAVDAFASDVLEALDVALGPEPSTDTWPGAVRAWAGFQAALDLLMTAADPVTGGRLTRLGEYALDTAGLDAVYEHAALAGAWLVVFTSALARQAEANRANASSRDTRTTS